MRDRPTPTGPRRFLFNAPRGVPHSDPPENSLSDAQPFNELAVARSVLGLQIVEKPPALANELQKPRARVVVFLVRLEVFREVLDALGQERDLHFGCEARIAAGDAPLEPSAPVGSQTFAQPMAFARIHQYLSMATPLLWTRQSDTIGVLGLALNACADQDGHADERERIRELLTAARDLWRALPEVEDEGEQRLVGRTTFRLVHLADILAVTSGA